jgi:hypothetical protein
MKKVCKHIKTYWLAKKLEFQTLSIHIPVRRKRKS